MFRSSHLFFFYIDFHFIFNFFHENPLFLFPIHTTLSHSKQEKEIFNFNIPTIAEHTVGTKIIMYTDLFLSSLHVGLF